MNIEANRTVATSARTRRTVLRRPMLAVPVLIAVLAGSAVGVNATDDTDPDDTELDGLVTEEVEPGVERIISDGAGHDLDERHPTYRYDMDDVAVTPDGTVWLWSSYHETDNDANPPGGLLWVLGEPGRPRRPNPAVFCYIPEGHFGVICCRPSRGDGGPLPRRRSHQRGRRRTGRHHLGRGRLRRRERCLVPHHSGLFHKRRPGYHLTNH